MHALNMHSYAFFFNFLYISYFDRLSRFAKFGNTQNQTSPLTFVNGLFLSRTQYTLFEQVQKDW